jgi:hypothetical protein
MNPVRQAARRYARQVLVGGEGDEGRLPSARQGRIIIRNNKT